MIIKSSLDYNLHENTSLYANLILKMEAYNKGNYVRMLDFMERKKTLRYTPSIARAMRT